MTLCSRLVERAFGRFWGMPSSEAAQGCDHPSSEVIVPVMLRSDEFPGRGVALDRGYVRQCSPQDE